MSIRSVMQKAANKIKPAIRKELKTQGHYLTGKLAKSLSDEVTSDSTGTRIKGTSLQYAKYLDEGFRAASASWKQLPFLIRYFKLRGLSQKDAERAAGGTIMTWMKEGMPTDNSKVYSNTNNRLNFIKIVDKVIKKEVKQILKDGFNAEISKTFHKTKSETI